VKVCTAYRFGTETVHDLPACADRLAGVEPQYDFLPGWPELPDSKGEPLDSVDDLPAELRGYMSFIEDYLKVPIVLMSTGPGREQTLQIRDPWQA
jgi:adenylosuccinate synthase